MQETQDRWWDGLLCGCLVVLAVLCTFPFAEMGFRDDFSYIKTAYDYAQTGHIVYNGWAAPILGWQIPWGALFVKIFGYSFTAVRWSILPIALITVWLFFAVLIRFGISRRNAYFGALSLGLSPVFLPYAASFMTEIGSEFIIILCIYLCHRAVTAKSDQQSIAWLAAAALSNAAGGTVRQIAWLGALVMVPCTAWLLRRRRGMLAAGLVLWFLSAAFIFACMHWFKTQPYSVPEELIPRATPSYFVSRTAKSVLEGVLCLSLLVFPLLAPWLTRMRQFRPIVPISIVIVACLFNTPFVQDLLYFPALPWVSDTLHDLGLSNFFTAVLGRKSDLLDPDLVRFLLASAVVTSLLAFSFDLFAGRSPEAATENFLTPKPQASWHTEFWLFVPFAICFLFLTTSRSLSTHFYDRYLLGLIPIAVISLLKLYQERFAQPLPVISYLLLGAISFFAIAGTHDWYALNRARLQAASILRRAGIPDTEMQLGIDYDGWTQLEHSPAISQPKVHGPGWTYHPAAPPNLAADCGLWSWDLTPVIYPKYFVVISPMWCLDASHFEPISYRTWLPPFHRAIYIQQQP